MRFEEIESTNDISPFLESNISNIDFLQIIKNLTDDILQKVSDYKNENPTGYSNFQIRQAIVNSGDKEFSGYSFMFFFGEQKEGFFLTTEDNKINGYILLDNTTQEEFVIFH